jgi:hypothetical protein
MKSDPYMKAMYSIHSESSMKREATKQMKQYRRYVKGVIWLNSRNKWSSPHPHMPVTSSDTQILIMKMHNSVERVISHQSFVCEQRNIENILLPFILLCPFAFAHVYFLLFYWFFIHKSW